MTTVYLSYVCKNYSSSRIKFKFHYKSQIPRNYGQIRINGYIKQKLHSFINFRFMIRCKSNKFDIFKNNALNSHQKYDSKILASINLYRFKSKCTCLNKFRTILSNPRCKLLPIHQLYVRMRLKLSTACILRTHPTIEPIAVVSEQGHVYAL